MAEFVETVCQYPDECPCEDDWPDPCPKCGAVVTVLKHIHSFGTSPTRSEPHCVGCGASYGATALGVDPLCPTNECKGVCDPEAHGL